MHIEYEISDKLYKYSADVFFLNVHAKCCHNVRRKRKKIIPSSSQMCKVMRRCADKHGVKVPESSFLLWQPVMFAACNFLCFFFSMSMVDLCFSLCI